MNCAPGLFSQSAPPSCAAYSLSHPLPEKWNLKRKKWSDRLMPDRWLVAWSVCHNLVKEWEVSLPCSYWRTCLFSMLPLEVDPGGSSRDWPPPPGPPPHASRQLWICLLARPTNQPTDRRTWGLTGKLHFQQLWSQSKVKKRDKSRIKTSASTGGLNWISW